jgi:hypothetical protein
VAAGQRSQAGAIEAAALVPAECEAVFDFLSDLGNHWRLAICFVEVIELGAGRPGGAPDSATVRLRGPLGLSRIAQTKVTAVRAPRLMIGTAEVGSRTRARVSWTLARRLNETRVRLSAEVDGAGPFDRAMLALGGRRWLERRFADTLAALTSEMRAVARPEPEELGGRAAATDVS